MSEIPEAALASELTTLALCWRLTRGDGLVLGFTSHDADIWLEGVRHAARPGMTPSAISLTNSFEAGSMEIGGVLSATSLSARDLDSGRWTGARVDLSVCDWTQPEAGALRVLRGTIGDVSRDFGSGGDDNAGSYVLELISDAERLQAAGAPLCSPLCRAELGDGACGVDMASRRREARILSAGGGLLMLEGPPEQPDAYAWGRLRIISGPMAGIDRRIAAIDGVHLHLEEPLRGEGLEGAMIRIWEGCDKRFETCVSRFANAGRFHGEPHVPGMDALFRYGDA